MMGLFIDVDPTRKRSSERGAGLAAGVAEGDRIGGVPTADRTPLAWLRELIRDLADLVQYRRERAMYRETTDEVESLFKRFVFESEGRRCLCLAFEGDELPVPAQSWPTLSLDQVERRARAEGRVAIDLEDRYFDAVLCLGLGYVWRPSSLLAELRRVLKDSGQLWIQVPLSAPYSSIVAERRTEYWRMTP
jgi:hypothetical protein